MAAPESESMMGAVEFLLGYVLGAIHVLVLQAIYRRFL
jgi:hypothetical protein